MRDQREGNPKRDGLKLAVSPSAENRIINNGKFFIGALQLPAVE